MKRAFGVIKLFWVNCIPCPKEVAVSSRDEHRCYSKNYEKMVMITDADTRVAQRVESEFVCLQRRGRGH